RAAEPARTVGAEPGCEVLDLWPKHVPGPALDLRKWHPLRPGDLHQETVTGLMPVERVSVAPALSGVGPELGSTAGPAVPGDQALEPCDPVLEVVRCPDLLAERPEISVPAVVAALAVLVEVLELCRPLVQRVSVVARDVAVGDREDQRIEVLAPVEPILKISLQSRDCSVLCGAFCGSHGVHSSLSRDPLKSE